MKISYAITVCNEFVEIQKLVLFLLDHKRIEDEIFVKKENIRFLKKDFANIKLEHEYLGSAEKLIEFQDLYFDHELVKKDIKEIKIIKNKLKVEPLKLID